MLTIVAAETPIQFQQVRELFAELAELDVTLMGKLGLSGPDLRAALDFYYAPSDQEVPGIYAPPEGRLFLASHGTRAAGCAAFRKVASETCELKRMYVRPEFRGKQIGWKLADSLVHAARKAGYRIMRLETTTYLEKAVALYAAIGFRRCQPYYAIPEPFRDFTIFMELDLTGPRPLETVPET